MSADRFARIETLYHAARARAPEERAAYLAEVCGDDVALRRDVESLLAQPGAGALTSVVTRPALAAGTMIGAYRIVEQIGAGGMGEVYRGHDTKLNRDVAVKVLPQALASDRDRLARLEREARLLASLNHPNIAHVYGLEETDRSCALVMELVGGRTLADAISSSGLSIDRVLLLARQIAEALDAAHEKGIVHRDLKAANVVVTADDVVKVLDFGLARANGSERAAPIDGAFTEDGVILGTAAYMSPEQARGERVDKRTDVWAFGCVLFELLAGRRPFEGPTRADTIAHVIEREPDWNALPPATPPHVSELLRRCLTKDLRRRLRDIGDALPALDARAPVAARAAQRSGWIVGAAFGILIALVAMATLWFRGSGRAVREAIPFNVLTPEGTSLVSGNVRAPQFVVSPDGRHLVFVAFSRGMSKLWHQPIPGLVATPMTGTDNASLPFWSADSQSVGFFVPGKLLSIALSGGDPKTICDAPVGRGGTWNRDNVIVFAPGTDTALMKVAARPGAKPEPVTRKDPARADSTHRFPRFLRDGRHFLFSAGGGKTPSQLQVGSLDSTGVVPLDINPSAGAYDYQDGYLLFASGGILMAQALDGSSLRLSGAPIALTSQAVASVSAATGTLAYAGMAGSAQLTWFDRAGRVLGTASDARVRGVALSPDAQRAAVGVEASNIYHIELIDLSAGRRTQFTDGLINEMFPIWSPDGGRIVFTSMRHGHYELFEKATDFSSGEAPLPHQDPALEINAPSDWSPDGRFIAASTGTSADVDIWMYPTFGDRKPFPFVTGHGMQVHPRFSPDGRSIAYETNESGRDEIWLKEFPAVAGGRHQVSHDGGSQPQWARETGELFFLAPDGGVMSVKDLSTSVPQKLFSVPTETVGFGMVYAVTSDGSRFLIVARPPETRPLAITIVLNWTVLLTPAHADPALR